MNDNSKWNRYIREATSLIEKLGWTVSFSPKNIDTCFLTTKRITIKSYRNPRKRFYLLLHELGHLIHSMDPTYQETSEKYDHNGKGKYSLLKYRIGIVEEEIIAWHLGELMAKKNKWILDESFNRLKAEKLSTYMIWAVKIRLKQLEKKEKELQRLE